MIYKHIHVKGLVPQSIILVEFDISPLISLHGFLCCDDESQVYPNGQPLVVMMNIEYPYLALGHFI